MYTGYNKSIQISSMTYHLKMQDYICEDCYMIFVPFRKNIDCPACGKKVSEGTELEYLNFINICLENMKYNMTSHGTYQAIKWYIGNYSDWMQSNIFDLCELIRINRPKELYNFLENEISQFDWDRPTIKHTIEITIAIYQNLSIEEKSIVKTIKQSAYRKIRNFLCRLK